MTSARLPLARVLHTQGFGSRRICAGLVASGAVRIGGAVVRDPHAEFETDGLVVDIDGVAWPYREHALVVLHKPIHTECSQRPGRWPSVMTLLPEPLRTRGVQPVGRLDADTTGLLLLTDDGALLHRLTSPKRHVEKVYAVGTRHPVDAAQLDRLRAGVVLDDDPAPVRATAAERSGEHALRLAITSGRYHQVKRMLAAVGNRVETLHRTAFGRLELPADLAPGDWRWADPASI